MSSVFSALISWPTAADPTNQLPAIAWAREVWRLRLPGPMIAGIPMLTGIAVCWRWVAHQCAVHGDKKPKFEQQPVGSIVTPNTLAKRRRW